ncbi:MAG: hypothetical protein GW939_04325 [Candidatus Magasanikbacteria bacterium]|nr:hypothetical protein [Candidatus Magasanikbacteria bacterium]
MNIALTKHKATLMIAIVIGIGVSFFISGQAKADSPVGDVVEFSPSSNWYTWFIRSSNETGHGQSFVTQADTEAISTVAFKLCRLGTITKPKTLTLCSSATNGWYGGCASPLATKQFTADELNEMINYDASCNANAEGGANDGTYYHWSYFTFDEPVTVSGNTSYFVLLNSASSADNESGSLLRTMYNNENYLGTSENYPNGQEYYYKGATRYTYGASTDIFFKVFSTDPITVPFEITHPLQDQEVINDTWVTVSGTCPYVGENRIGFTDDCLGFEEIQYTAACTEDHTFSAEFYHTSLSDRVIAREVDSISGDCVDYDNLMDFVTVDGIEFVDGYPEDWYFNFGIYDDYDITIKSPVFDVALTLPRGSTSKEFTFSFTYPEEALEDLTFVIAQYDSEGNLITDNFHTRTLESMADTSDYQVTLSATTTAYHYVVQLIEDATLKRQYPFGIFVSDLDFVANPDETNYFFPRIVTELRKKIVFNYYFAFHDGFYNMFNGQYSSPSSNALDITFKSMSGDGQYNLDVKVFSASDPRVKSFTSAMRPYIVALLWLSFALYVVFRITHLFSDNE